ncbi:MAG: S8/S53 family peptidase [Candidatus Sericytochromatia bacterium]|nr:S8/S53 family peptidase [Candidatus Sericytochromatia bacterium]
MKQFTLWGPIFVLCLSACQSLPDLPSPHTQLPFAQSTKTGPAGLQIEPFQLMFKQPSERQLALLKQRWQGEIRDQMAIGKQAWVLVQFSASALPESLYTALPEAWQEQEYLALQQEMSQNHWQTLMLAEDIRREAGFQPGQIQLNPLAELPQTSQKTPSFNDLQTGLAGTEPGWWRRETGVERAWEFSIGTAVRVAWLDVGFKRHHPEVERRLILTGDNNQTLAWNGKDPENITLPVGDHGAASIMVGFAERHNGVPSVGVAPNAQVLPYVAGSVWEAARALKAAAAQKPDVIGMNFAWPMYPGWEKLTDYSEYLLLKAVIQELGKETQLPLVIPAHNYGEPITGGPREWFPINLAATQANVLGVGGVEFKDGKTLQVWFNPDILTGYNSRGSNYGAGLIWAPSVALDIAGSDPAGVLPNQMSGTSASAPFMAGVMALLRSRCPDLSARQLIDLLLNNGKSLDGSQILGKPGATVPFVQADLALAACLRASGKNPTQYRAQHFSGILEKRGDGAWGLKTETARYKLMATLSELQPGYPQLLEGKAVALRGWQKLPGHMSEELEVLELVAD